jgi:hypothetical protein
MVRSDTRFRRREHRRASARQLRLWYYYQLRPGMTRSIETVEYRGWGKVARITNGTAELLVLTQMGPRVLLYGFAGGENQLHEFEEQAFLTGDGQYHSYAGHRLWVSPEVERTYYPDNFPVQVTAVPGGATFTAPVENAPPGTGLQKEFEVRLASGTHVTLLHRITNRGSVPTEMAPWALTVMEGGGRAILPLPPRQAMSKQHLLPEGVIGLWSYTDLADARWKLGTQYVQLTAEASPEAIFREQMLGLYNPFGWAAYFRNGHLFVKRAAVEPGRTYPDFGCNFETYTEPGFLELETLGPLRILKPRETAEHIEHWWLFKDVPSGDSEAWIEQVVLPLVNTTSI